MTTVKGKIERQNAVMLLSTTGKRIEEIAKKLGVGHRTVDRDLTEIRERVKIEIFSKTPEDILTDLQMSRIARIRGVFSIIGETMPTPREKLLAANLLRKEDNDHLKRLQVFGLVPKESKKLTVNVIGKNIQVNKIEELNVNRKMLTVKTT